MSYKFLKELIEKNDIELKKKEDKLIQKSNQAYMRAVKEATKEFEKFTKLDSEMKISSKDVKHILERTIKAFRTEFETLVIPFQKELKESYEDALVESSILVAASKKEEE